MCVRGKQSPLCAPGEPQGQARDSGPVKNAFSIGLSVPFTWLYVFKEWLTPFIKKWKKKNTAEEKYLLAVYLK